MEITKTKQVDKEVVEDVVEDILCNKCGGSCKDYVDRNHEYYNFNSAIITSDFGYGSVLYDMEDFKVHLCETCYAAFEATFKIKPEKKQLAWG